MKTLIFSLLLILPVLSEAQKKIKSPIVLHSGDTLKIDDIVIVKNGTARDSSYQYVHTKSGFPAPKKCRGYEQSIYYFRYIDETYYAYTAGFKIDIEKALNSGEIMIHGIVRKTAENPAPESKTITEKKKEVFQPESIYLSRIKKTKQYPVSLLTELDLKNSYSLEELKNRPDLLCMTNMRYCLRKYHHIRRNGRYFALSGFACSMGCMFINNTTVKFVGTGVGGGLLLTGGVLYLVAERWMKYSTIKPVIENDRVGLSITF